MSRIPIRIKCKIWIDIKANIFFARMPYLLDEFEFIDCEDPDFYIFSHAKDCNAYNNCIKIYNPGENNRKINMNICHWALAEKYEDEIGHPKYIRMPNYVRLGAGLDLIKDKKYKPEKILAAKTKFCAFIYKNKNVPFRNDFFKKLSRYKHIDSPGLALNNMPSIDPPGTMGEVYVSYDTKVNFLRHYKFTIAFANECSPGYTSEKIYHAMLADCLPIYWGNPQVHRDFNPKSFINLHSCRSVDEAIEKVIELDRNDDLYLKYLQEPWYHNNIPTHYADPVVVLNRFKRIFSERYIPPPPPPPPAPKPKPKANVKPVPKLDMQKLLGTTTILGRVK